MVIFVGSIDLVLSILSIIGFDIQTRSTEWYKMTTIELYSRLQYSLIFIIFGLLFFKYIEPKIPEKEEKNKKVVFSICPKCNESFTYNDLKNGKCLYCENIDTIGIEEYYKENKRDYR
jgi:uncharacterized membrane protein